MRKKQQRMIEFKRKNFEMKKLNIKPQNRAIIDEAHLFLGGEDEIYKKFSKIYNK